MLSVRSIAAVLLALHFAAAPAVARAEPASAPLQRVQTQAAHIGSIPAMARRFGADTVVFDLDDTLIRPTTMVGAQRWFDLEYARLQHTLRDDSAAFDAGVKLWDLVHAQSKMVRVERSGPRALRALAADKRRVIALTARDEHLISPTLGALGHLGMSLGRGGSRVELGRGAYYKDGVIFAGSPQNKAYALRAYHQRFGQSRRVMFVDDSANNVKKMVAGSHVPILGVHYTGSDVAKRKHDDTIARVQLRSLRRTGRIPSNTRVRIGLMLHRARRWLRRAWHGRRGAGARR